MISSCRRRLRSGLRNSIRAWTVRASRRSGTCRKSDSSRTCSVVGIRATLAYIFLFDLNHAPWLVSENCVPHRDPCPHRDIIRRHSGADILLNWLLGCPLDQLWLVELEMVDVRRHRMTDHPSLRIGLQELTRLGYPRPKPGIVIFAAQDRGHLARRVVDFC